MTRPAQSRDERLNELVSIVNGIRWGMPGYDARLVELGSGFPGGSGGGGSKGSHADPTQRQVEAIIDDGRTDPAAKVAKDFERRLEAALHAAEDLWSEYKRVTQPRVGVSKLKDPGCELCAKVAEHWCPTFGSLDVGAKPNQRRAKLCSWCYRFAVPSGQGRLPTDDEVLAHAEGRRVVTFPKRKPA